MYIDQNSVSLNDSSQKIISSSDNSSTIGKKSYDSEGYFNGKIDDIRIYDRALLESEINVLYHEGSWD